MICSSSSPESEKIYWMLTGFFLLCCSFHHATILKIGMVKRMWELLYGMYTKMINGEFNLLYYKNILTVMRYYSGIYPDNIM